MSLSALISLAWASLWNRRASALLTITAVAVSVMLFLGVDKLKTSSEESFQQTITGTDMIVGARTSPVSLVMFTVFHIGDPAAGMTWESYEWLQSRSDIEWTVPISLGDSHDGYRVVGTDQSFFERYQFRDRQTVSFVDGVPFDDLYDVVVGADVAAEKGYAVGDEIELSHGTGPVSFQDHSDRPFTITGILDATGTPVDESVLVSLLAIEAIHVGWQSGAPSPLANMMTADDVRQLNLRPHIISSALVGLSDRRSTLNTMRAINTYSQEALVAAPPAQAIAEVWELVGVAGNALMAVSAFVILVGLVSILTSILTSLRERRREMAVLRAIGAGPAQIMTLLISEAVLLAATGAAFGIALVYLASALAAPIFEARFGIALAGTYPGMTDLKVFLAVIVTAGVLGLIPAIQALKNSLADGLSIKL